MKISVASNWYKKCLLCYIDNTFMRRTLVFSEKISIYIKKGQTKGETKSELGGGGGGGVIGETNII